MEEKGQADFGIDTADAFFKKVVLREYQDFFRSGIHPACTGHDDVRLSHVGVGPSPREDPRGSIRG